jgi:hypothetical protein
MKRFAVLLLVNLFAAAGLCVAGVGVFMVTSMIREMTGLSTAASAGAVVAFTIIVWSAVQAWLETL